MTVNPSTFKLVAGVLGVALLGLIAAISVLAGLHDDIPRILENLATGALTALAALLVSPHGDDPTPVTIADEPVQVTTTPAKRHAPRGARGDRGEVGLILLLLFVVALAIGGIGFAVHVIWWGLIIVLVLAVVAVVTGRRR